MNKNRLEAFSDGVFAIVITLLILDIRIPDVKNEGLPAALFDLLPKLLTYVMSFLVIGAYWVFHHYYFEKVKKIDGTFLFINLIGLLLISFLPFPTSLMGKYPLSAIPILIYGLTLVATNLVSWVAVYYLYKHPGLAVDSFDVAFYKKSRTLYITVNGAYLAAATVAFIYPIASYIIYIVVLTGVCISVIKRINILAKPVSIDVR